MSSHLTFLKLLCFLFAVSNAIPTTPPSESKIVNRAATSLNSTQIIEFPKGTWLENLAIRQADGNALVTILSAPEVYLVSTSNEFKPIKVATFPGTLGCLGIVELGHDVFYVIAGNWSATTGLSTPGTYSVWELDLRGRGPEHAKKTKIADFPDSGFLNGMTVLNPVMGILLISDSWYSAVWSVNVYTGEVAVAINDTTMAPEPDPAPLGVNGIQLLGSDLYYDNSYKSTLNKIPIDLKTGKATGPAETILQSTDSKFFPDDFAIDFEGNVWVCSDPLGELDFLSGAAAGANSVTVDVVAGSTEDEKNTGWTAAQFGTKQEDLKRGSLYITTNGGPGNYANKTFTAGGMLIRIDTAELEVY